ncbi:MAG: transporter suffix domain-containing protein, partial [Salibacteraceae bacterium]
RSWKYKVGMFFLILMIVSPGFAVIMPYLGLSETLTLSLQGLFLIGGPEVFMIIGIALAGKEALTTIKNVVKKIFGMPPGEYAASEPQYRLGLTFVFIGMLIPFVMSYIPVLIHSGFFIEKDLWINLAGDVLFILGVLVAGEQFTTKVKSLFTWDRWELGD